MRASTLEAQTLKDLKPERIEVLVSASSTLYFESLFGHISLFIIPKNRPWREGRIVSFVARTENEDKNYKYYYKGISGKYPFVVDIQTPEVFFNQRLVYESRDIDRYALALTDKQKENIWKNLLEYHERPESLGSYYFHIKNCASMFYFLLQQSGLQVNYNQLISRSKLKGVSPKKIMDDARIVLLTPYPP